MRRGYRPWPGHSTEQLPVLPRRRAPLPVYPMHLIFSKKVIWNFHKVLQISIAVSERKSDDPTLRLYDFGHAHPWTCWIPLDFDHGASSHTGSALAAGRPFYLKLNLLIFIGGAAVQFRKSEQQ